jgi:AcrR family transcriptional regulator
VSTQTGLRERKKQQTRQLIAETARRLFAEHGFEKVTVAEIARAADVSQGTVFNYFPTKEDLFYSGMEAFETALLEAVRNRPAGESVLAAFRGYVLEQARGLGTDERADVIVAAAQLIDASASLQAREREIVAESTRSLATLIAEETTAAPGDTEPMVVATALMGAQRALVEYVRAGVLGGQRGPKFAAAVRSQARRAFARLESGLGDYNVKAA